MIIILGPAGAGKSVQGKMLADEKGYEWISIGGLLREADLPQEVKDTIQQGDLVSPEIVESVLADKIKYSPDSSKIIVDGFPRNKSQAEWLIKFCNDNHIDLGVVLHIKVDYEIARQRLMARGRADDYEEAINKRFEKYEQETLPIIEAFRGRGVQIAEIDGRKDIAEVHQEILRMIDNVHQS